MGPGVANGCQLCTPPDTTCPTRVSHTKWGLGPALASDSNGKDDSVIMKACYAARASRPVPLPTRCAPSTPRHQIVRENWVVMAPRRLGVTLQDLAAAKRRVTGAKIDLRVKIQQHRKLEREMFWLQLGGSPDRAYSYRPAYDGADYLTREYYSRMEEAALSGIYQLEDKLTEAEFEYQVLQVSYHA
ncbi:hypothetical protein IWQ60_010735 [Tieghemiomyces parasiticus]|uniref:Uncharacterized protein n=1 Tax=Tieghemiomyces parasiticus TaxID=78921 RepID=A0A9W8DMD5_9FUNG|nr:hypothetical protein IWQ60_010735 [Tieghemiomyces parasiticus]